MMLRLKVRWVGSLLGLFYLLILLAPVTRLQAQPAVPPDGAPVITPPPRFDPAQLGRGEPLPGSDYPAAAATPLPDTGAAAAEHGRPDGIDLDVLYIERTPKYERYTIAYDNGVPLLQRGSENAQRWPAPGETVTFAAHVMNKGMQPSGSFAVAWYIDGQLIKTDEEQGALWPGMETVFELQWVWDHRSAGERLLDAHTVRLVVDPNNQIAESFETNNELEDRTDALALELAVAPQVYAALDSRPRLGGSFSAEDWLQRHVRAFNRALADSIYPATPDGVGVRVRIDKIRIAWEQPHVDPGYDGGWFVKDDYRQASIYYHADEDLDWGMLHEWGHQLGLIDTYRYWVSPAAVDVLRQDGSALGLGYDFPGDGLMETVASLQLGEFNAAGLQATQGYRRGFYGEYQFDLAPAIVVALTDSEGCPVPDVSVAFFQRNQAVTGELDDGRRIDDQPEFTGFTAGDGRLALPNRSSGGPHSTITGYTLRDNPFGRIEVSGSGNIALLRLQKDGREQFAWLTVAGLNLQYWRQNRPAVQEVTLIWEGEGNCTPPPTPPATPLLPPDAPAAPDGLSVLIGGQSAAVEELVLTWQDAGGAAAGFQVEWAAGDAPWTLLAAVGPAVTEQDLDNLACGTIYRFRVRAFNSAGVSAYSTELAYATAPCVMTLKKLYLALTLR